VLLPARIPDEVAFPHPLVRAAVYDDLSPTRRRALHLTCAELASGSASLTHRVAASEGADDVLAAELQATAESDVSAGRLTAGVERLLSAARIAGSAAARETALLRAVELLVLAGEFPRANSLRDAVLSCGDSPRRSFIIGMLGASIGHMAEAQQVFREVIARPDFSNYPELEGPVTSSLAIACALMSQGDEAMRWSRRAINLSGAPPTSYTTARQAHALGLLMSGRGEEGIAELGSLSASRIEPEPFEPELLTARGNLKVWWGDLAGAAEDLTAVVAWSRAGFPMRSVPNAYAALAEVEYRLGRWDDGLAHAELAVSLGEDSNRTWDLPFVHAVASYLNAARGNLSTAAEHVESARRASQAAPLPMGVFHACAAAVHLAWVQREWDSLIAALGPMQMILGGAVVGGLGQRVFRCMAIEAILHSRDLDEAAALLDKLESELAAFPEDPTLIELWRLRGVLAQARRRPAEARAAFERGDEVAGHVEAPLYEGLLELAHGQLLRKNGGRRAAIAALRVARDRFTGLGAHPFLLRCEGELTACGVRSRERGDENRYGLTPREDVVARLVASGKSNREVAGELYLSTKAIEYHLGNVFAKLNVRSRHELAGRLTIAG
jgi:DNA-binding CsgD family transcriptional regulator